MNNRVEEFKIKNAKSYVCGEKGFWEKAKQKGKEFFDRFKKTVELKDLDGKVLYQTKTWKIDPEDYGFQKAFEKAVKEGVALPRLDASNRKFSGIMIPNAEIPGASFENSEIRSAPIFVANPYGVAPVAVPYQDSIISEANLKDVNFKNAKVDSSTIFRGSDVTGANLEIENIGELKDLSALRNLDKANGVSENALKAWQQAQTKVSSRGSVATMTRQKTR